MTITDNQTTRSKRHGGYVYPNGLICDAPPHRVQAFERIMPPIAFILLLTGALGLPTLIIRRFDGLHSINVLILAALSVFFWFAIWLTVFISSFNVVCRPTTPEHE